MKIIVTDAGYFWNHNNSILEKYANHVMVVCLNGEKVTDKYKCFISPYKQNGLGIDDNGTFSLKYKALESVAERLSIVNGYRENILFLTDSNPQSLYPYLVLKDNDKYNQLHLCCISPFKFEGKRRNEEYLKNVCDFSQLKSLLYIDSNKILEKADANLKLSEIKQYYTELFKIMLPRLIFEIESKMNWDKKYYYDTGIGRYISIDNSYDNIIKMEILDENDVEAFVPMMRISKPGLVIEQNYPDSDEDTKDCVRQLMMRLDGKKVCEQLKAMRVKLADANNIPYETIKCPSEGPCVGTCQQCDKEINYLRMEMMKIPEEERIYPFCEI